MKGLAGYCLLALTATQLHAQEFRTWTGTGGSRLEAALVRQEMDRVVLKNAQGELFRIRLQQLSPADQAYLGEQRQAQLKPRARTRPASSTAKASSPSAAPAHQPQPSVYDREPWIFTEGKPDGYPPMNERSGKWLIFASVAEMDALWSVIRQATENGLLGCGSKVSTAYVNPHAQSTTERVICVYTYDWTDTNDVMRIRAELRRLGVVKTIPYKSNEDTRAGQYAKDGAKDYMKYWE